MHQDWHTHVHVCTHLHCTHNTYTYRYRCTVQYTCIGHVIWHYNALIAYLYVHVNLNCCTIHYTVAVLAALHGTSWSSGAADSLPISGYSMQPWSVGGLLLPSLITEFIRLEASLIHLPSMHPMHPMPPSPSLPPTSHSSPSHCTHQLPTTLYPGGIN